MALLPDIDLKPAADLLLGLLRLQRKCADKDIEQTLNQAISIALRRLERKVVPEVSVAAAAKAKQMGLLELQNFNWYHQKKQMQDPLRRIFHWEHVLPCSDARRRLAEKLNQTMDDAIEVLQRYDIAWVLKEENARLRNLGYESHRPDDPWDAYRKAEIKMCRTELN